MRKKIYAFVICLATAMAAFAGQRPDFSGTWVFNPEKSKNVGMMATMKMTEIIEQSATALDIHAQAMFQQMNTHYDLSGKAVANESMTGASETVSKWDGDRLVTTWRPKGEAGSDEKIRTETRMLSPDGRTMTVESVRGLNGPVILVFDRK